MVFGMLTFLQFPVSAYTISDGIHVSVGKLGAIYYIGNKSSGSNYLRCYKIDTYADAEEIIDELNERSMYGERNIPQVNVLLCDDWVTSDFINNMTFSVRVDLGGHKWTVTDCYIHQSGDLPYLKDTNTHNISVSNGTMCISGTAFKLCSGAVFSANNVTFQFCEDSVIFAGFVGGSAIPGMSDSGSCSINLKNVTFEHCTSDNGGACIEAISPYTTVTAENCLFKDCRNNEDGGAIGNGNVGNKWFFKNCRFEDCYTDDDGGVIYNAGDYSEFYFSNCAAFRCNSYDRGGFLADNGNNNSYIGDYDPDNGNAAPNYDTRMTIASCYAIDHGGAIYTEGDDALISGFNFSHCIAGGSDINGDLDSYYGGAIYMDGENNTVANCDFCYNKAGGRYGGAIFQEALSGTVNNCTFEYNDTSGGVEGSEVYVNTRNSTVKNCVFRSNYKDDTALTVNANNCTLSGNSFPTAYQYQFAGSGTEADPYRIYTGYEMTILALMTNYASVDHFSGKYFRLENDVRSVTVPIGIYDPEGYQGPSYSSALSEILYKKPFSGTFDGNGHSVELWQYSTVGDYKGLFAYTQNAEIKDLIVNGKAAGGCHMGAIIGYADCSHFVNLHNNAEVYASGQNKVAGIAAETKNCILTDCVNNGKICGRTNTAGIIGYMFATTLEKSRNNGEITGMVEICGGIAGTITEGSRINGCVNNALVIATSYCGGIVGQVDGISYVNNEVMNCVNTKNGRIGNGLTGYSGGIIGVVVRAGLVLNCANYADIMAHHSGGLIGWAMYAEHWGAWNSFNGGYVLSGTANAALCSTEMRQCNIINCFYVSGKQSDTIGTAVSPADCGTSLVKRLNSYFKVYPYGSSDWTLWTEGGTLYNGMATVNINGLSLEPLPGSGTKDDPYMILSEVGLRYLADDLAKGNSVSGKYFRLKRNISYTGAPIGTEQYPFDGYFDGGDHIVTAEIVGNGNVGLFGVVKNADIRNLTVSGTVLSEKQSSGAADYTGAIAGKAVDSTVINCYSTAIVTSLSEKSGNSTGGIVGYAEKTTLIKCANQNSVSGAAGPTGGIVGTLSFHPKKIDLPSLVGGMDQSISGSLLSLFGISKQESSSETEVSKTEIISCQNNAEVKCDSGIVGGIVGKAEGALEFDLCENGYENGGSVISGTMSAGGIIGAASGDIRILNTANYILGKVSGAAGCGGIVGVVTGSVKIENSGNYGAVTAAGEYAGGMIGNDAGADGEVTVYNCFAGGAVTAEAHYGALASDNAKGSYTDCCYLKTASDITDAHGKSYAKSSCTSTNIRTDTPYKLLNGNASANEEYLEWFSGNKNRTTQFVVPKILFNSFTPDHSGSAAGSVFANGGLWAVITIGVIASAGTVLAVAIAKKKKKENG